MPIAMTLFFLAALGSLTGIFYSLNINLFFFASILFFALAAITRQRYLFYIFVGSFVFCCALLLVTQQKNSYHEQCNLLPEERSIFHGRLEELSTSLDGRKSGLFAVDYILVDKSPQPLNIRLAITLENGAAALPIEEGDIIRLMGKAKEFLPALTPGTFDAALFGFARDIHGSITIKTSNHILIWHEQNNARLLSRFRTAARKNLSQLLLPREAAVVLAQLIGDTRLFENEQKMLYRQIGAGHLLAVSGLQVSLFAFSLFKLLHLLLSLFPFIGNRSYSQRLSALLAIVFVWFFVGLCGYPPSAIRAGLMATVILCGFIAARNISTLNAIGLAGLFSILYSPACVIDPGFLLSYCALLGLVGINAESKNTSATMDQEEEPSAYKIRRQYALSLIFASICASLMTMPLSAYLFGEVALIGVIANIVVVPVASFLQIPALLGASVAIIFHWQWAAQISAWLIAVIESLCEGIFRISFGIAPIEAPSGIVALILTASFFAIICLASRKKFIWIALILGSDLVLILLPCLLEPTGLKITVLAVGQGDSSVFQTPSGHTVVVDGGGVVASTYNPGQSIVAPFLQRKGIKHIDVMVVSHPDPDHILGLFPLMENFSVGELWHSGYTRTHPLMKQLIELAQKKNVLVKDVNSLLGKHFLGNTKIEVLGPKPSNHDLIFHELGTNDNSLVLRFSYGKTSALWPGDIEFWGENYLLEAHAKLQTNVVKAPHHGSKTSSSPAFVAATKASHVIFCTGTNNRWHFPHSQVLKRWQDTGAQTWNTGENGQITLWLTGTEIKVQPFRF